MQLQSNLRLRPLLLSDHYPCALKHTLQSHMVVKDHAKHFGDFYTNYHLVSIPVSTPHCICLVSKT